MAATAGQLADVSVVSVGVVLLKSGRTTSGDELTVVQVSLPSGIGAHCVCITRSFCYNEQL